MKNRIFTVLIFFTIFLSGCKKSEFQAGDCVQAFDGYVWRIHRIESDKYYLSGWLDGKWGNEVDLEFGVVDGRYIKITCPGIIP